MPKIVLFASLLLLAYGANSASTVEKSTSNPIIAAIEAQIDVLKEAGNKLMEEFETWVQNMEAKVAESIAYWQSLWASAIEEINEYMDKKLAEIDASTDTSACQNTRDEIVAEAKKLEADIYACEYAAIEKGYALKEDFSNTLQTWTEEWAAVYNKAVECLDNDSIFAAIEIPVCLVKVQTEVAELIVVGTANIAAASLDFAAKAAIIEAEEVACAASNTITAFKDASLEEFDSCLANVVSAVVQ